MERLEAALLAGSRGDIDALVSEATGVLRETLAEDRPDPSKPGPMRAFAAGLPEALLAVLGHSGDLSADNVCKLLGNSGPRALDLRSLDNPCGIRFDRTNPEAQRYAREQSAKLITDISKSTRAAVSGIVDRAFSEHMPPAESARLIRDVVGLLPAHAGAVENYREALRSAEPGSVVTVGSGSTSQKIRIPEEGLDREEIAASVSDYADALVDWRADTIARTETLSASNEGQEQLWDQAVEAGLLPADVEREWIVTNDDTLCPVCEPLAGERASLGGEFQGDGETFDGPPAHPNCRCTTGLVF